MGAENTQTPRARFLARPVCVFHWKVRMEKKRKRDKEKKKRKKERSSSISSSLPGVKGREPSSANAAGSGEGGLPFFLAKTHSRRKNCLNLRNFVPFARDSVLYTCPKPFPFLLLQLPPPAPPKGGRIASTFCSRAGGQQRQQCERTL